MTKYIYRILYRLRPEHRIKPIDDGWQVLNNRSYNTLPTAQGVMTNHDRQHRSGGKWRSHPTKDGDYWHTDPLYEYKLQKFPMTQEWEDID